MAINGVESGTSRGADRDKPLPWYQTIAGPYIILYVGGAAAVVGALIYSGTKAGEPPAYSSDPDSYRYQVGFDVSSADGKIRQVNVYTNDPIVVESMDGTKKVTFTNAFCPSQNGLAKDLGCTREFGPLAVSGREPKPTDRRPQ